MAIHKKGPTKRALEAQKTKEEIFNASINLFAEYGYDTVTVDDITKHVGVSKGSFYNHFESKDAVLVAQFNRIDEYYKEIFKDFPPDTTASERLLKFVSVMADYRANISGINVIKVVYRNQISIGSKSEILLNKSREIYKILRSIVNYGQETGEFITDIIAEEMVELFARSVRSIIFEWCLCNGEIDLKEQGLQFMEMILRGLRTPSFNDK